MNPYISKIDESNRLQESLKQLADSVRRINASIATIESVDNQLKDQCTHKTNEDVSAIKWIGQEPGSGRSLFICSICDRTLTRSDLGTSFSELIL